MRTKQPISSCLTLHGDSYNTLIKNGGKEIKELGEQGFRQVPNLIFDDFLMFIV